MSSHPRRRPTLLLLLCAVLPTSAAAQQAAAWDAGRTEVTRPGLEQLLTRYEQTAASPVYTPQLRARADAEAETIRTRLREGDFQTGDQIGLSVEGERDLTGTFVVNADRAIVLPVIGDISLAGVLRSELQESVARQLGRYIKDPVVVARSSIRILISGAVAKPGYYVVDTHSLLSDALMIAGGPMANAKFTALVVERADAPLWSGATLQQAIAQGRTLDELGLRAGDHVVLPLETPGGLSRTGSFVLAGVPSLILLVSTVAHLF